MPAARPLSVVLFPPVDQTICMGSSPFIILTVACPNLWKLVPRATELGTGRKRFIIIWPFSPPFSFTLLPILRQIAMYPFFVVWQTSVVGEIDNYIIFGALSSQLFYLITFRIKSFN